jgi:hypothetical protein
MNKAGSTLPFATVDGEVPGVPSPATPTDLASKSVSDRQRQRVNDYVANPLMPGSIGAGGEIRDMIADASMNPAQPEPGPPDDVQAEELPPTGDRWFAPDPPAGTRGCGSINETAVPFRDLHADKRTR